ncbi:hypothetical protein PHYPSEUDO_002008 [Phytophthora pseudosyringae]|uniref:FYVE-type domain-containing protein n=1 Tax=Phytophthora pseudosyringae TaxID=221518 RepID=A0A8T1VVP1_9STRA|nr:hypothetical protein PHYPSEUDO_002008 [Phytophthora pseudosyringae]
MILAFPSRTCHSSFGVQSPIRSLADSMDASQQRHRRFPRPRVGSRGRAHTAAASNMVELETLSAFSALERRAVGLSEDEAQVCSRLAELLLADALRAYDGHSVVGRGQRPVDLQQWKPIKKKDQLCAYKQRKEAAAAPGQQHQQHQEQRPGQSETDLPLLLVTGYLAGHVNDAMYGLASANTRAMKMNSAYAEDALEDAEVLATIEGPSIEEPFRFLGLKWAVRHDAMSKRRDLLYLEATGVTKLANGDRVGYRVMHSVSIKALALLATTSISSSVIRARASIVQLFHQQPSSEGSSGGGLTGTLNVFTRGYYDPQGGMMQFMAVNAGAELLLHMTFSVVDCAHLKKIAFAAQQAGRRRRATSQLRKTGEGISGIEELCDEDADAIMGDGAWSTNCSLCDRRVGHLLNRSGAPCAICAKMVCSRCSVVKKLRFSRSEDSSIPVNDGGVDLGGSMGVHDFERPEASLASTERSRSRSSSGSGVNNMNDICQKALKFCLPCVLRANQRNASQIVVEEILEQTSFGLVTPRSTMDRPSSRSRPSSMRRRSTQTGRPYSLRSSQAPYGAQQFPHYAASPYCQPRQKAYSGATYMPPGVHRSSSATPRVVLYVEDPASSGYSAA